MPWVNTIAADRKGAVVYADHSVVPNVSNAMTNRCVTPVGSLLLLVAGLPGLNGALAGKQCAWANSPGVRPGDMGTEHLPAAYRRDRVGNAHHSYLPPTPQQRIQGVLPITGYQRRLCLFPNTKAHTPPPE